MQSKSDGIFCRKVDSLQGAWRDPAVEICSGLGRVWQSGTDAEAGRKENEHDCHGESLRRSDF